MLSVCLCVTDVGVAITNLRVVCKIIIYHRNGYNLSRDSKSCCWSRHSALQATRRMPLWTLAIALATGKNTRLFGGLDQNKTARTRHHFLLTCHSVQRARQPLSRRAISLGSFTGAVDFVLQLNRLERTTTELITFILWLINSPCTDRK